MSKLQHVRTATHFLFLEVGWAGELGPGGLHDAIIEALDKAGTINEAAITYIRTRSPELEAEAVDVWVVEAEAVSIPPTPVEPVEEAPANIG